MVEEPEQKPERPRPQLTPEQQEQRQAALRIADALGERVTGPRAQVGRVVQVLGIERAEALYEQALEVEAAGGMMLPDGSRRRTPGGVFFKLVRDSVSDTDREKIVVSPINWPDRNDRILPEGGPHEVRTVLRRADHQDP